MGKYGSDSASQLFGGIGTFFRRCIFRVLSVGPIPSHLAFIMDGNRRFAKKHELEEGAGHKAGYLALMSLLKYCYELGVKYVTIYAFSIDNFRRQPHEVKLVMDLMLEKIEGLLKEESIVNQYGVRVHFVGTLKLLSEPVRIAAEKVMKATANNNKCVLLICVAYTSTDEIMCAVQASCEAKHDRIQALSTDKTCNSPIEEVEEGEKTNRMFTHDAQESFNDISYKCKASVASRAHNCVSEGVENKHDVSLHETKGSRGGTREKHPALNMSERSNGVTKGILESEKGPVDCPTIKLVDLEKHMYMGVAPEPNVLVRTSGETRLSNFLLWQTSSSLLYTPDALWPEIGLRHLVWAVLNFQRNHAYLEKKKKQS